MYLFNLYSDLRLEILSQAQEKLGTIVFFVLMPVFFSWWSKRSSTGSLSNSSFVWFSGSVVSDEDHILEFELGKRIFL